MVGSEPWKERGHRPPGHNHTQIDLLLTELVNIAFAANVENKLDAAWLGFQLAYDLGRLDPALMNAIGSREGWNVADVGAQALLEDLRRWP